MHEQFKFRTIKLFGIQDPIAIEASANYAMALQLIGRFTDAVDEYQVVVENAKQVLGEDHPNTLSYMSSHALAIKDLGLFDDALATNTKVINQQELVLGELHYETILSKLPAPTVLPDGNYSARTFTIQPHP